MGQDVPMINFERINAIGERLGASYEARKKWRQRGHIPFRWRVAIVQASNGEFTLDDFETQQGGTDND